MDKSIPNMEGAGDKWEFGCNDNYREPEMYDGKFNLEKNAADCWEPPENGSDFSGSIHQPADVVHDVYDGFSIENYAGESDTDGHNRDRSWVSEDEPEDLIHPSISLDSYSAVSMDETLLVDHADRVKNAPTYHDGIDTNTGQLSVYNKKPWSETGEFRGTKPRKWSVENDGSGGDPEDSSPLTNILKNLLSTLMQSQHSDKLTLTSLYTIINTKDLDQRCKTRQEEQIVNMVKQFTPSAKSGHGAQTVCVVVCLLFGLHCFHSIIQSFLWNILKPLQKQMDLPPHSLSMTKGMMPYCQKKSILNKSLIPPISPVLSVYMMEVHEQETDMLQENQQRTITQVSETVVVVPPHNPPDHTNEADVGDESDTPDHEEETPQSTFQHVETPLSGGIEHGCSDRPSCQTSRRSVHFTGNKSQPGNTFNLHRSTEKRKGELIYGTHSNHILAFLSQRRTPERRRPDRVIGVLRHPSLQNMSTEEGFQMDRHYVKWKELARYDFGRMMVCRGLDNLVTFIMIERESEQFREEELLFYLEYAQKVTVVPELLGVVEEDSYIRMMFPFTPGHAMLSDVMDAGMHIRYRPRLLLFLEQLVRGIDKLHKCGGIIGGINDHRILLDLELNRSGIFLFPSRPTRATKHMEKTSTDQPFIVYTVQMHSS